MKVPPAKPFFPENDLEQISQEITEVLRSGWLTSGPKVQEFERQFARYVDVKHAIAVNSGTAALACALKASKIEGSTILVPDNTFAATAHAVMWNCGTVDLVDIVDEGTFNVGLSSIEKMYNKKKGKVKGVIVVHIGGHPVDMDSIQKFCDEHELVLLEDAAHAHGSEYKGKRCGSIGSAGCFSFYPTKVMTTGEGGMITTNNDELAEKCRNVANQGRGSLYTSDIAIDGFNYRMSDVNACIGLSQLKHLDEWIRHRRELASLYNDLLSEVGWIESPPERNYAKTNYYKYACLVKKGASAKVQEIKDRLKKEGVSCGMEVFWPPLHRTSFYGKGTKPEDYPVTESVLPRQLCLPMFSSMTEDEVQYVVDTMRRVM
jgi:dTDP-4-amino-4,6-dideoxygalactose transaminase